jgi:hypothetical protein
MNKVLLGLALALGIGSALHPASAAQYGLSAPQAFSSSVVEAGVAGSLLSPPVPRVSSSMSAARRVKATAAAIGANEGVTDATS